MEACQNVDVLKVLYFGKLIFDIIKIIIPIGLIVMGSIDFAKGVMNAEGDKKNDGKKLFFKRIIYALLVFFVPTIVNMIIISLGKVTERISILDCFANANSATIKELEAKQKEEEEQEPGVVDLDEPTVPEEPGVVDLDDPDGNTSGSYYAPIQSNASYTFSSIGTTGGCGSAKVYHDISINEGVAIYAGMDGTAEFIQTTSTSVVSGKTVLTSYGNQVKITNGNTVIIYAHLSRFSSRVNTPITETCPKRSDGSPPCSASNYPSTTNVVDKKTVRKGDLIGYTGDTGNSTAPHLHVEIKENGVCVCDPFGAFGMRNKLC